MVKVLVMKVQGPEPYSSHKRPGVVARICNAKTRGKGQVEPWTSLARSLTTKERQFGKRPYL